MNKDFGVIIIATVEEENPSESLRYRIFKVLEDRADVSQRELSKELGISLGKVNYCLRALQQKGVLKVGNFRNSKNKLKYMYILTPSGFKEKAKVTRNFLQRKEQEFEKLKSEIDDLRQEVSELSHKK